MDRYRGADPSSFETLKSEVSAAIRKNGDLLQNALQEAFGPMKERESLALLSQQAERIFRAVESLEAAVRGNSSDTYFRNFGEGLRHLEDGVSAALVSLSKSIAAGKLYPEWPDLPARIASLDEQAAQARKSGASIAYPLDEMLRCYALLLSSRNLAGELESTRALLVARLPPKTK
jgi:hypothetical protein